MDNIIKYLHYNLYLDAPVDIARLQNIRILKIRENLPLTDKLNAYIQENGIKYIEFGESFNQPIDALPSCIEHIFFNPNSKFNHPLANLPSNLKTLILGSSYFATLEYLPHGLLYLGYHKWSPDFTNKYGNGIIKFEDIFSNLPSSLIYLSLPNIIQKNINFNNATSVYCNKIIKTSSELDMQFTEFINERHNQDYFCIHG